MRLFLTISFFSFLFLACRKGDSWKEPSALRLEMGLHSDTLLRGNDFLFDTARLSVRKLLIEARHEVGGDLFFERDISTELELLRGAEAQLLADFELPQGAYSRFSVGVCLQAGSALAVKGVFDYNNPHWEPAVVEFLKESGDTIWFELSSATLSKDAPSVLSLQLNAPYWFRNTKSSMMQQAAFTQSGNRRKVSIDSRNNPRIYSEISAQMGKEEIARLRD